MGNGYNEMLRGNQEIPSSIPLCVGRWRWGVLVGLIIYISVSTAITVMFMAHTVL